MSIKLRVGAATAVAVAAAAVAVTTGPPAGASTAACGVSCSSPSNLLVGAGETLTISFSVNVEQGGTTCPAVTAAGIASVLAGYDSENPTCSLNINLATASSTNAGQDWSVLQEGGQGGNVGSPFVADGALSPKLSIEFPDDNVDEFEATPNGAATDYCLAYDGAGITLSQCGVAVDNSVTTASTTVTNAYSPTLWIADTDVNGYVDLISGYNQVFSVPGVLTATGSAGGSGSKQNLTVQPLGEFAGNVPSDQMWAFAYSTPAADGVKQSALKHT